MQLSIIIVNYNVKYFLEQCLVSVTNACKNLQAEILVVDNCSTDGSKEYFADRFAAVTFIWQSTNTGFSAANNAALRQAAGEKILFLNPDTLLPEDCFEKCLHFFDTQSGAGAIGIRMVDGSGLFLPESKRGFPSPATSLFKMTGLAKAFPSSALFAKYYLGHLPDNVSNEADVLAGAFMMVAKKVLDITGGFDEAFFMYGEDIDLSYRILKAGYKNFYFAESTIIHFKGESTKKGTLRYVKLFYGAMALFVKKHYSESSAFFYAVLLRCTIIARQIPVIFKKSVLPGVARTRQVLPLQAAVNTLIVADPVEYAILNEALKKASLAYNIAGRISSTLSFEAALGNFDQLEEIIIQQQIGHIVFCTGDAVSMVKIIDKIQRLSPTIHFSFHLPGTKSIVSSSDKNREGFSYPTD